MADKRKHKNNRGNWSTRPKPLTMPEKYKDYTLEELEAIAKPSHIELTKAYFKYQGNITQAYKHAIWLKDPKNKEWIKGKTDTEIGKKIANKTTYLLKSNLLARALIVKNKEKFVKKAKFETEMSFNGWANRLISLRNNAEDAGQFSPAIRGHELLGRAAGHIDSNRQHHASREDDKALVDKLTDILGVTADSLNSQLSRSEGFSDAIDAEVIDPEQITHQ